jgi:excinuclease ABC subunit B
MGRAARHLEGKAILYADVMTDSMKRAIEETTRRRTTQLRYNEENGEESEEELTPEQREKFIGELEQRMRDSARKFEFEKAAQIRDRIKNLRVKDIAGIGIPV